MARLNESSEKCTQINHNVKEDFLEELAETILIRDTNIICFNGTTWCVLLVISLNLKYEMWQNHMGHSENSKIELTQIYNRNYHLFISMVMEK